MTTKELNRDVKRLNKLVLALDKIGGDAYFKSIDISVKPEFIRLLNADREFLYLNRTSILILLRLNLRFRIVAFHTFGLNIDLTKLQ